MSAPRVWRWTATPLLHVDMDAFYASLALRDRPEWQHLPVVVGGGHRGVVLAANYPARRFGVRSGMSGAQARRLCPHLRQVAPDYDAVGRVSRRVMEVLGETSARIEVVSVDEAFLDVRGALGDGISPELLAARIRARVREEVGLACSVGIAGSVAMAKLASRRAKPDGVVTLAPRDVPAVVHPLDVGELYGIGPATRDRLHRLGFATVGDLARTPEPVLVSVLGPRLGAALHALAWGRDRSTLSPGGPGAFGAVARLGLGEPEHSLGAQRTLAVDLRDPVAVETEALRLLDGVAARLRARGAGCRAVAVTVRRPDFTTVSRQHRLPGHTDVTHELAAVVRTLLRGLLADGRAVRLVGVRLEGVVRADRVTRQEVLGEADWRAVERAADRAAHRFGRGVVRPARLLGVSGPAGRDGADVYAHSATGPAPGCLELASRGTAAP
ncbi:DNA polymerase IV [Nocardioides sp.]|uniref:Y-family DNA polymerase n=1 Tax=Nocardioides sp. TaxID=35761 RepID=UPI003513CE38